MKILSISFVLLTLLSAEVYTAWADTNQHVSFSKGKFTFYEFDKDLEKKSKGIKPRRSTMRLIGSRRKKRR